MSDQEPQVGRPPTLSEKLYQDAAKTLGPAKTVERLDAFAKYLLGLATLAAALISGFGLLNAEAIASSFWLAVPMALFSASLGIAIWSITPALASLNLNVVSDVQGYYEKIITDRAIKLRVAGTLFALGIFTAPIAVSLTRTNTVEPRIRTSAHLVQGKDGPSVATTVTAAALAPGTCIRTIVRGTMSSNTSPPAPIATIVLDRVTVPDAKGSASVTLDATPIDARVTAVTVESVEEKCSPTTTLTVGPASSPP